MDFDALIETVKSAMWAAETQAKIHYNENALAQVALSYSLLALAEAFYHLSIILKKEQINVHGSEL